MAAPASITGERYELTLFVSGASRSSARAIRDAQALCEAHFDGRYQLTIVDLNQDPDHARGHRVLATPTLVKDQPLPERMAVGDLSDTERVLHVLDMRSPEHADAGPGK
jgi:circadian clock protein KaiB